MIVLFHLLILSQVFPYYIVWGGNSKNEAEMMRIEIISVLINSLLITVIAIKGKLLKFYIPIKIQNYSIGLFPWLFLLNTIANLLAKTNVETILFTPITIILTILSYRISIEKE